MEVPRYRTGRTTRMIAEAYKHAVEGLDKAESSKPKGLRCYYLNVYVIFYNEAQASAWRQVLERQLAGPCPSNLHFVGRTDSRRIPGPCEEFEDHAVKYQAYLDRGIQPWEMSWQSNWDEYTRYDLENAPLELKRPRFSYPDGTPYYPSIPEIAMQMRVLEGHSDGCGSEEHF